MPPKTKSSGSTKVITTTSSSSNASDTTDVSSSQSSQSSQQKKTGFKMDLELLNFRPHDDIKRGMIEVKCTGVDCNDQFLNAIGRIAIKRIPMYAFAKTLIKIERINTETGYHDSVPFNHDMMRDRLKNTPVMNLDPGIPFLHEKYWRNVDYRTADRQVHENEKRVEIYIDQKNVSSEESTDNILHVTTNDAKIYVDDELTNLYSEEYPLLILSLKPKEAFRCSMRAVLGVGLTDACWDACSNFCYDQETIPGSTIMKFQSASQFDEFVLIERSLEYFRIRTKLLKDEINRLYLLEKDHSKQFIIVINDEDHTMGEPINYEIQSHDDIAKSSSIKPDHLVRQIVIDVEAFNKEKMLDAIMESMDNLLAKIDRFEQLFKQLKRPAKTMNTTVSGTQGVKKPAPGNKDNLTENNQGQKQNQTKDQNNGPTKDQNNGPTKDQNKEQNKGQSKDKSKGKNRK